MGTIGTISDFRYLQRNIKLLFIIRTNNNMFATLAIVTSLVFLSGILYHPISITLIVLNASLSLLVLSNGIQVALRLTGY